MSGTLLLMSGLLGAGSFADTEDTYEHILALVESHLGKLSTFGTGLLLGAALGVIIPEGIEAIATANVASGFPTSKISLSLLGGFTFMLVVEQLVSSHSHSDSHSHDLSSKLEAHPVDVTFDADIDLEEMERSQPPGSGTLATDTAHRKKAYPLTLGLIFHGLTDGLALGASALSNSQSLKLSFVVFFALVIHKAPTALALTTSLLSTSLPRSECKKHIACFSASTPFGALVSYALFSFLGTGPEGDMTGIALLISGGTFLYVATVLQSVSDSPSGDDLGKATRVALIAAGMFTPFIIGTLLGHGHDG